MERELAVNIVKEIFDTCPHIIGRSVKIMPPDSDNVLADGCQIHVNGNHDEFIYNCLKMIAEKNDLSIRRENSLIVIYKPRVKC